MKALIFVLMIVGVHADYLNTKTKNHCVYSLLPNQNNKGWCYTDRNTGEDECDRRLTIDQLIDGYYLDDDGNCVLEENLKITGLTKNQWDWLLALMGQLVGFTVLFLVSFLAILSSRK